MPSPDTTSFNALLAHLNDTLSRLAKQHQKEVEAAASGKKPPRSKLAENCLQPPEDDLWSSGVHEPPSAGRCPFPSPDGEVHMPQISNKCLFPIQPGELFSATCSQNDTGEFNIGEEQVGVDAGASDEEEKKLGVDAGAPSVLLEVAGHSVFKEVDKLQSPSESDADIDFRGSLPAVHMQSSLFTAFVVRQSWLAQREFDNIKLSEVLHSDHLQGQSHTRRSHDYHLSVFAHDLIEITNYWFIVSPESKLRGCWVLLCMACLMYDLVMVPINVCFDLEDTDFSKGVDFAATLLWTADILLTFMTGIREIHHLELRPSRIARSYLRGWFWFDLGLVLPEWLTMALQSEGGENISVFRVLRWGRLMRLLRMARIGKTSKLKSVMRRLVYVFNLSKVYIQLIHALIGVSCALFVFVHVMSCFWYALGISASNGWVKVNNLDTASVAHSYVVTVHWTFSRLHGIQSYNVMERSLEIILDALLVYISMFIASYFSGILAAIAMTSANSGSFNLWRMSILYVKRHKISPSLDVKMNKFLEAQGMAGAKEQCEEDAALVKALPHSLQHDLLFESRGHYLTNCIYFKDLLSNYGRVVRQLCIDALLLKVWIEGEMVWGKGDTCVDMLFITSGSMWYTLDCDAKELEETMNQNRGLLGSVADDFVENDARFRLETESAISEAVLWTPWTHVGNLVTADESTALALDHVLFFQTVKEHKGPLCHAVKYAKHFCWQLNRSEDVDDLTSFPLGTDELEKDLYEGGDHTHYMFLSHYKVEAGTEATLMRDSFQEILRAEPTHPANSLHSAIFVDSEDLTDLSRLKDHVIGSNTLVLLLTPGVLSRPWCLVEIVTAVRENIAIVPVEIQRPGSRYTYPNDEFYAGVLKGAGLPQGAVELLESEGITLLDVVQSIRQVFLKIALPFSPHKSQAIRDAELHDILKRCSG